MAITWEHFEQCGLRAGTVVRAEPFPEAKKPAYKLWIDFGPFGIKPSSAQITVHYKPSELIGRQVICVTNFPPKQIGPFRSEVLTTGFILEDGTIALAQPERKVPDGAGLC